MIQNLIILPTNTIKTRKYIIFVLIENECRFRTNRLTLNAEKCCLKVTNVTGSC